MRAADPLLSRRDFLSGLLPARRAAVLDRASLRPPVPPSAAPPLGVDTVAVIAGRHCLAYLGTFCSVCRERCPVPGAIVVERGLPRVDAALCNGCRVCHDVCPAPTNAIRLAPGMRDGERRARKVEGGQTQPALLI